MTILLKSPQPEGRLRPQGSGNALLPVRCDQWRDQQSKRGDSYRKCECRNAYRGPLDKHGHDIQLSASGRDSFI